MIRLCLVLVLLCSYALPAVAQKKLKTAEEYYNRGNQNLETKPTQALADFEAALKLDSSYCAAYSTVAYLKQQKSDFKIALKYYSKAVECMQSKNDKQGVIMFTWNRGLCKHEMKDYQGALQDYCDIIAVDSSYTTGYTLSSFELLFLRKYDAAIALAKQILGLPNIKEDDKMSVERFTAHAKMLQGNTDEALAIHKAHQNYKFDFATWKEYVAQDFADFRKAGLATENMTKVEAFLKITPSK